jgi:hypothetical protein
VPWMAAGESLCIVRGVVAASLSGTLLHEVVPSRNISAP